MTVTARCLLTLALMLFVAAGAFAQEPSTAASTTTGSPSEAKNPESSEAGSAETSSTTAAVPEAAQATEPSSYEVRNHFTAVLGRHPHELPQILKLDPSLLTNEAFMSGYPAVAQFVQKHPEIIRNPRFYLAEYPYPGQHDSSGLDDIVEMILVFSGFALAAFALGWFIRTIIEQKRWNRLNRTQTDVHTKILDRFGTSQELLEYIRTPAGTKFLESAPIPLHADKPVRPAPQSRVLWSIQLGVIIAAGALGMILVSFRFEGETAQGLFAMGAIAFSVGAGFIASAMVSIAMARRLSGWQEPGSATQGPLDDAGLVR